MATQCQPESGSQAPASPRSGAIGGRTRSPGGEDALGALETERRLAQILGRSSLGVGAVGRTAHFAMLGGSSLSAAQLVNRVREHFGRELSLKEVLLAPTLEDMARSIDGAAAPATAEPTRRQAHAPDAAVAASEAQARMVFLDRAHPGTPLNNIPLTLGLEARLDETRLREAVAVLTHRHRMLRATLRVSDRGVVQAFDAVAPGLEVLVAANRVAAMDLLRRFHQHPFALEQGPLWRVAVARAVDTGQEWLALSLHHAIADGVTLVRVLAELDALYRGEPLASMENELTYSDFVAWQEELLAVVLRRSAARFWSEERQQSRPPKLPHSSRSDDVTGRQFAVDLDPRQTAILKAICEEQRVSPFVLMLTVFGFVIGQRCQTQQLALGVTFSGRSRRVTESVPGLFVNTLPLAFDCSSKKERFSALLQRVKSAGRRAPGPPGLPPQPGDGHAEGARDPVQHPLQRGDAPSGPLVRRVACDPRRRRARGLQSSPC